MARKTIREYKAKSLLFSALDLPYFGKEVISGNLSSLKDLPRNQHYVVKVDQGIKKRFKLGLISLDVPGEKLEAEISSLEKKGYSHFIIEPFQVHETKDERYLAIQRTREGFVFLVSSQGGINIEDHSESLKTYQEEQIEKADELLQLPGGFLKEIIQTMDRYHFSFLEINPLVIKNDSTYLLDLAVEVDSAGAFFVNGAWSEDDFVAETGMLTEEEKNVKQLSRTSQASFKLDVLNPNGSIFMLLSGGGASIVVADEVYNQGKGKELANYGEYSGNPNGEETYFYTKQILSLMLKSEAKKKMLIIAGGVANFTDIRVTFKGIIQAIDDVKKNLKEQNIKVFVRRGGPYQEEGLAMIKDFLIQEDLYGLVSGPEMVLTDIVTKAMEKITHD